MKTLPDLELTTVDSGPIQSTGWGTWQRTSQDDSAEWKQIDIVPLHKKVRLAVSRFSW